MACPWLDADLRHLLLRRGCLCEKLQIDGGIRYLTLVLREGALVVTGVAVLLLLADDLVLF